MAMPDLDYGYLQVPSGQILQMGQYWKQFARLRVSSLRKHSHQTFDVGLTLKGKFLKSNRAINIVSKNFFSGFHITVQKHLYTFAQKCISKFTILNYPVLYCFFEVNGKRHFKFLSGVCSFSSLSWLSEYLGPVDVWSRLPAKLSIVIRHTRNISDIQAPDEFVVLKRPVQRSLYFRLRRSLSKSMTHLLVPQQLHQGARTIFERKNFRLYSDRFEFPPSIGNISATD